MRMSKQIRWYGLEAHASPRVARRCSGAMRFVLPLFLVIALLAGLTQPSASSSPASLRSQTFPGSQQGTSTIARNAALIAATQDVLKETSGLRQLPILRPVQSSTQSRAEIEQMLIRNLNENTTPAQLHATEVTLKKLGLAPADFEFRALMIRLLTEQVAGYYDPKTREFHLADWIDLDGQKPVMAHELTHALQDQHFNLRRFEHWPRGDSDAELAAHALIEGDATLAMSLYVASNPLRALAFLKSLGASGMTSVELDKAPRAVRESLLFPYQEGSNWTRTIYRHGGWKEVSEAFSSLPESTEQILHPEKYFAHEAPVKVTLPDVTPLLNGRGQRSVGSGQWAVSSEQRSAVKAHHSPSTGTWTSLVDCPLPTAHCPLFDAHRSLPTATWRRIDSDVNGEWGFYLILDQFLRSPAESRRAAAGWGGDRYSIYEGPKGEVMFVCLSTWDTENDAREFFDAYVKRTPARYASAIAVEPTPNKESNVFSSKFQTSQGTVLIERRGSRVLIVEGDPGGGKNNLLLNQLWR